MGGKPCALLLSNSISTATAIKLVALWQELVEIRVCRKQKALPKEADLVQCKGRSYFAELQLFFPLQLASLCASPSVCLSKLSYYYSCKVARNPFTWEMVKAHPHLHLGTLETKTVSQTRVPVRVVPKFQTNIKGKVFTVTRFPHIKP